MVAKVVCKLKDDGFWIGRQSDLRLFGCGLQVGTDEDPRVALTKKKKIVSVYSLCWLTLSAFAALPAQVEEADSWRLIVDECLIAPLLHRHEFEMFKHIHLRAATGLVALSQLCMKCS